MRKLSLFLFLSALLSAQTFEPKTTLRHETGNNTSALRGLANGDAEPGNVSKLPIRSLLYPGSTTIIVARFMPWFGAKGHEKVGYHSDDQREIERQVADMMSRGIDGAIVDWYGAEAGFKNKVTERLFKEAENRGFKVALSEDVGALKECAHSGRCDVTDKLSHDLQYIADHFYNSPAYLQFNGRPVVMFFGLEKFNINWNRVRMQLTGSPMLLFRNANKFDAPYSDGAFSWTGADTVKPGNPYGFGYLENFYDKAHKHPNKFAMGSVMKGFNDSQASWGKGFRIDQNCGKTWLSTFGIINQRYSADKPLPAVEIVTWNDWEEGTEIESGIENCVSLRASVDTDTLRWEMQGPKETVDHFAIFASRDGENLMLIAQRPNSEHELGLRETKLPPGRYKLFVKAVGRASLMNHMAAPVDVQIRKE
jgi:hypothetical protein